MKKLRLFFPFFTNSFSKNIFFNPLQFQDQFKITQTNFWSRTVPASLAHEKLLFNCPPSFETFPKLSRAFPHCSSWLTSNILFNELRLQICQGSNKLLLQLLTSHQDGHQSLARGLEAARELVPPRRGRRRAGEQYRYIPGKESWKAEDLHTRAQYSFSSSLTFIRSLAVIQK